MIRKILKIVALIAPVAFIIHYFPRHRPQISAEEEARRRRYREFRSNPANRGIVGRTLREVGLR